MNEYYRSSGEIAQTRNFASGENGGLYNLLS